MTYILSSRRQKIPLVLRTNTSGAEKLLYSIISDENQISEMLFANPDDFIFVYCFSYLGYLQIFYVFCL